MQSLTRQQPVYTSLPWLIHPLSHPCTVQVKKLSSGDPLTTHRELYLRNVSSKELKFNGSEDEPEVDLAPANRQQGDTISFDK